MTTKSVLTDFQKTAALREEVREENAQALVAVMQEYHITIAARDFSNWRPTVRTCGLINGLEHLGTLTCVATDGMTAYYVLPDGKSVLHGHVEAFEWDEHVESMVTYYDKEEKREKVFKVVKHNGAPPTLNCMPKRDKGKEETKEKKACKPRAPKKDATALARELLETLLNKQI